jgi:hypothetical protein
MSEEKFLRLIELERQRGNKQGELDALRGLKAFRSAPPPVAAPSIPAQANPGQARLMRREAVEPDLQGGVLEAVIEPAAAIATAALAEPISGLAGIASAPFTDTPAGDVVNQVREALTFQPRTEAGKAGLQAVGEFLQPVGEALQGAEENLGGAVFEATGSPAAAAAAASIPTAALELIGVGLGKGATKVKIPQSAKKQKMAETILKSVPDDNVNKIASIDIFGGSPDISKLAVIEDAIAASPNHPASIEIAGIMRQDIPSSFKIEEAVSVAERAAAGVSDSKLSQYIVDAGGKLREGANVDLIRRAVDAGFDEDVAAMSSAASEADRLRAANMLSIQRKILDSRTAKLKQRPADVVGESIKKRYDAVRNINKQAGADLEKIAKRDLKGRRIVIGGLRDRFLDNLADQGIVIDDLGKLDFSDSAFSGNAAIQSDIRRVLSLIGRKPESDAYRMHIIKQRIDDLIDIGKPGEGLKGRAGVAVKGLRRHIKETLDKNFDAYAEVNARFSDSKDAMEFFSDSAGASFKRVRDSKSEFLGTLSRTLSSNNRGRSAVQDAVNSLENVANKYGKTFDDSLDYLLIMADELESVFGSPASTSLPGILQGALTNSAVDLMTGAGGVQVGATAAKGLLKRQKKFDQVKALDEFKTLLQEAR